MRNLITFIALLTLVGCTTPSTKSEADGRSPSTKPNSPVTSLGMVQSAYTVFDEAGTPVIKGTLILPWPPPSEGTFSGTWQAKYSSNDEVSPANKLGPQTGGGRVAGELSNGRLRLNLNPTMNDNNVSFTLVVGEIDLKGEWMYSTFAGPTGKGAVEAKRE